MNNLCLCITSLLVITSAVSKPNINKNRIRVTPAENQSIAGVFQVTHLNYLNQPQYAYNASEARRLCLSLGVDMASKEQVQRALTRGLETCRFGWIDEHFAVIPRIHAVANCGRSQTGLVPWRASVTQKFDVFCFNETDAAAQLKDTPTDSPLSSKYNPGHTQSTSTQKTRTTSSSSFLPSSSAATKPIESEAEPARYVGGAQRSSGGKLVLITCTSAFLIIAVVILAYLKLHRRCSASSDEEEQQEYIETEEWTCVKNNEESKNAAQQDERIEVSDEEQ